MQVSYVATLHHENFATSTKRIENDTTNPALYSLERIRIHRGGGGERSTARHAFPVDSRYTGGAPPTAAASAAGHTNLSPTTQVTRTPPRTPPAGLHGRHEELHPPHPRRPTPNRPGAPRSAGFPGARRRPCGAARWNFRWRGTRERGPGRRHGGQGAREGEQQRRVGAERECDHSHVRRTRERAPSSIVLRVALREVGGTWRFDVM
jgi:hypothetical protein